MGLFSEVHHVAIAVYDLDKAMAFYTETFGCEPSERENLSIYGAEAIFLKVGHSHIQLISPSQPDSELHEFLRERGEGLHHVAFQVSNCKLALEGVKLSGHRVLDSEPQDGPLGIKVARIEPKDAFGTLIELVQLP